MTSTSPPVPSLPPASALRRYSSIPPDFLSPIRHYHADEKAQNLVFDAWEASSINQKFKLCRKALDIFPFSVDAFNCMGDLYRNNFQDEGDAALEKAEQAYKIAIDAANLLWPELKEQESIEWGHIEHRPFLRAHHGLGCVQDARGKAKESAEKFRFLLRVNPNDNQGVRTLFFYNLISLENTRRPRISPNGIRMGEIAQKRIFSSDLLSLIS